MKNQLRPISERDKELLAMPTILSQLPINFKNKAKITEFNGNCSSCNMQIEDELFRGLISKTIDSTATIEAVGVCSKCNKLSLFNYRVHDDMRLSGMTDDGWKSWQMKSSLIDDFWHYIKKLF